MNMKKILALLLILAVLIGVFPVAHASDDGEIHISPDEFASKSGTVDSTPGSGMAQGWRNSVITYEVDLGNVIVDLIEIKVRTGTVEAGTFEVRLDNSSGELLGSVDTTILHPLDWATIIPTYIPLKNPISGNVKLCIITNGIAISYHDIILYGKDPNAVTRVFSSLDGLDSFKDISKDKNRMEINLMTQLGLFTQDKVNFIPECPITRLEFVDMLGRFIKAENYAQAGIAPFKDVSADDEKNATLAGLYNLGVIKGDTDGNFRAKDFITLYEAASVCVNALGYRSASNSVSVFDIANSINLFKGVDTSQTYVNKGESARILYNLFKADTLVAKEIFDDMVSYKAQKNYIENNSDYVYNKGIVSSNYYTDLHVPIKEKDTITINDTEFKAGNTRAMDFLGLSCEFIYYEKDGEKIIAAIFPEKKAVIDIVQTNAKIKFTTINEHEIVFIEDGEEYEYELDATTAIIYNGIALDSALSSLVNASSFAGSITFIDNNDDGIYDCVLIDNPQTMIISNIGAGKIRDKQSGTILDFNKGNFYFFKSGTETKPNALKEGDVLTVYQSANRTGEVLTRVIIDPKLVSGKVTQISGDVVTIDGVEYLLANECTEDIYPGLKADFYLNAHNRIITYKLSEERNVAVGLFMAADNESNGLASKVELKILTEQNNIEIFKCAEKIIADGVNIKETKDFYSGKGLFSGMANVPVRTPILYSLDSNGCINMVDTELTGSASDDDTLTKLDEARNWWTYGSILIKDPEWDWLHPYSSNIKTIAITADNNESNFAFIQGVDGVKETIFGTPYTLKRDSIVADLLLATGYTKGIGEAVEPLAFEKISVGLNAEGERCRFINGFTPTGAVKYEVSSDKDTGTLSNLLDSLNQGDIIQPVLTKSKLTDVKIVYLPNGALTNNAGFETILNNQTFNYSIGDQGGIMHGKVDLIESGFMRVKRDDGTIATRKFQGSAIAITKKANGKYVFDQQLASSGILPEDRVVCWIANRSITRVFVLRDESAE